MWLGGLVHLHIYTCVLVILTLPSPPWEMAAMPIVLMFCTPCIFEGKVIWTVIALTQSLTLRHLLPFSWSYNLKVWSVLIFMPFIDTTHNWKAEEFLYMLSLFRNLRMILVIAVTCGLFSLHKMGKCDTCGF